MTAPKLSRDDWEIAALGALERGGPGAVAVVPLARELGVSRGSFYWHFDSREELLAAAVDRWTREHVERPLTRLEGLEDPRARLSALFTTALTKPPTIFAQLLASDEPAVAAAVRRATDLRQGFLEREYRATGMPPASARRQATLAYAAYIGIAHLLSQDPELLAPGPRRAAFARHIAAQLIPAAAG